MYGLLFISWRNMVLSKHGEDKWKEICDLCGFTCDFVESQNYPDRNMTKLIDTSSKLLELGSDELLESAGYCFFKYLRRTDHWSTLLAIGRTFRDFVRSLTSLHGYVRADFPEMQPPCFIIEREDRKGLIIRYYSKRRYFVYYLIGILKGVALEIYHKELEFDILGEESALDGLNVILRLNFDNSELKLKRHGSLRDCQHLPLSFVTLLDIFPFAVTFNRDTKIEFMGCSLDQLLPNASSKNFLDLFEILDPVQTFSYYQITEQPDSVYNIRTKCSLKNGPDNLLLRGHIINLSAWRIAIFLGSPVISTLDFAMEIGLYLNDLPMHDFSRDNVLARTQESSELRLSLETEQEKSDKIKESIRKLDEEMDRTNKLLYQMIPEHITERLKAGESPVTTCQKYDCASILLSDVVRFTEICSHLKPMNVVSLLNTMYSAFDRLTEKHGVCKIETIGDAYMVVAGLQYEPDHAARVCNMALDMLHEMTTIKDPNTGKHLRIRVGVSSGPIVAGIVGQKMPRYCIFGKTAQTTTFLEQTSRPAKIHLSETTVEQLPRSYMVSVKGAVDHPNFTGQKTYWLDGRRNDNEALKQEKLPFEAENLSSTDLWCFPIRYFDRDLCSIS